MAKTGSLGARAWEQETFVLVDDTEVEVRSLPIAKLRKALAIVNKLNEVEGENEMEIQDNILGVLLNAVAFIIQKDRPDLVVRDEDEKIDDEKTRERLEDVMDQFSINGIIKTATGVDLDNPNLGQATPNQVT